MVPLPRCFTITLPSCCHNSMYDSIPKEELSFIAKSAYAKPSTRRTYIVQTMDAEF